jgi:two-component system phosphate regulon sensor histidine kinase PhoR
MFAETMRLGRIRSKKDQKDYLTVIVNESERLTRLINTVLDFSRIERGDKQYQLKQTNISNVVHSALNALEQHLQERGFKVQTDIGENVTILADPDAIEQAIINLINNSIKYSHKKKEVSVQMWEESEFVYIQVADKGFGIHESDQEHIFDKFYRAHAGHERDTGGAGLGLTVVKNIVEAHQGKIKVESQVGEGTIFTIELQRHNT